MAREPVDDLLAELDAALQASPSPDAIARVRERVRADAPASGSRWWLIAAASVVIVIVGAAAAVMTMRRDAPAPAAVLAPSPVAPVVTPITPAVSEAPAPRAVRAAPAGLPAVAHRAPAGLPTVAHRAPAGLPTVARSAKVGPEVLVPPEEGEAIRRLLRAIRDGRATAAPANVIEDADGRLLEAKPIEIPLIKIEPLPGTQAPGSGGREK